MSQTDEVKGGIVTLQAVSMNLETELLKEAAKALRTQALNGGFEYCKSLLGLCAPFIGVYLAALSFAWPKENTKYHGNPGVELILAPVVLAVVAGFCLSCGFLFRSKGWLDVVEPSEIKKAVAETRGAQQRYAVYGGSLLVFAAMLGVLVFSKIWVLG